MASFGRLPEFSGNASEWDVFAERLRDLASQCEYGDSAKELIRDRLVCGVRDDTLQRVVRDVMQANPDFTRKSLSNRAKNLIQEEDDHEILRELQGLETNTSSLTSIAQ